MPILDHHANLEHVLKHYRTDDELGTEFVDALSKDDRNKFVDMLHWLRTKEWMVSKSSLLMVVDKLIVLSWSVSRMIAQIHSDIDEITFVNNFITSLARNSVFRKDPTLKPSKEDRANY